MSRPEFYKHSGRIGALGIPLATLAGLAAAGLLGVIYTYAINWIPFIYINFFLTLGFGLGVGIAVGLGARFGKIRNSFFCVLLGAAFGVVALYFAWAFDPPARSNHAVPIAWHPQQITAWMQSGYENGFWTIGRGGGGNVKGAILAIVWLIEAGAIIGMAGLMAFAVGAEDPFCEECNAWTVKEPAVATLLPPEKDETTLEDLLDGDLDALQDFDRASPGDYPRLEIDLYRCETCDDSNYMTVKLCTQTVNNKGEASTKEDTLLDKMYVADEDVDKIRDAGREARRRRKASRDREDEDEDSD